MFCQRFWVKPLSLVTGHRLTSSKMGSYGRFDPFQCPLCLIPSFVVDIVEGVPQPCIQCNAEHAIRTRGVAFIQGFPQLGLPMECGLLIAPFLDGLPRNIAIVAWKRRYLRHLLVGSMSSLGLRQFIYSHADRNEDSLIDERTDVLDHILGYVASVQHVERDILPMPSQCHSNP